MAWCLDVRTVGALGSHSRLKTISLLVFFILAAVGTILEEERVFSGCHDVVIRPVSLAFHPEAAKAEKPKLPRTSNLKV